ncbi:hypothetical protein IJ579_07605 [bacterium]|nr:hypothetical protein [bacterium]
MSINAINSQLFLFTRANKLRQVTRQALIALGIDPNSVSSEEEAQALIKQLLSQKVQTSQTSESKKTCSAESEIIARAKSLASLVGITLTEAQPLDKTFQDISDKIDSLSRDGDNYALVQECRSKLESLKEDYFYLKRNEGAVFAAMDFNANINKMLLGL